MPKLNVSALVAALVALAVPCSARAAHVNLIELDNQIISPVTQQYITDGITRSEQDQAECLVLVLDTPGGLLESTRAIVKRMMNAAVPIVVYVAPSGARAGSAGVFITLAGHIAAMAPSTNIGAAHPVTVEGGGPMKKIVRRIKRAADQDAKHDRRDAEELVEESQQDPMSEKILNDTVAWATTIARARHRNEAWAKRAVTESVSVSEQEAAREGIIDFVAKDLNELLAKIDGWPLTVAGLERTLSTKDAPVRRIAMTPRQQFLAVITNPNIAYLLMLLGTMGLVFEFTHPGAGFPGIAGLICVILSMYAFQTLPINYAGLALIGLGFLLLVAEVKVPGFGLLALGGVVSLTLGSLMLVDAPGGLQISLRVILPVVAGVSAVVLFLVNLAWRAHRQPAPTGASALIGQRGVAETDLALRGQIFIRGEIWNAEASEPIKQGETVRVESVDGMTLRVARAAS